MRRWSNGYDNGLPRAKIRDPLGLCLRKDSHLSGFEMRYFTKLPADAFFQNINKTLIFLNKYMKKPEKVLVICAHNDDQIVGVGGTLAKYSKQGKNINTLIFSYGELSHPHLKPKVIIKTRVTESHKSDRIIGGAGVYYLGLKEGKFLANKNKVKSKIKAVIKQKKPSKIFTHSRDDPHPDHRAVFKIVNELINETKNHFDVYSFGVWNLITLRKRNVPKLVVDITDTFNKKVKAFQVHKSQKAAVIPLMWKIYLKDMMNGWNNGVKYAEVFHKIK